MIGFSEAVAEDGAVLYTVWGGSGMTTTMSIDIMKGGR